MFMLEVSDRDDPRWMVLCGSLHVYISLMLFIWADLWAVTFTLLLYSWFASIDFHWSNAIPLVALAISLAYVPFGLYALIHRRGNLMRVYSWRCILVSMFSMIWTIVVVFIQKSWAKLLVGTVWFTAIFIYIIGCILGRKVAAFFDVFF